jgi:hypothetical protein
MSSKKGKKVTLPPLEETSTKEGSMQEDYGLLSTPGTITLTVDTPRTTGSLHFDSLYPDIIEEGENIDFYIPDSEPTISNSKSTASLHFETLYPDIIEEGENIDFYVPEASQSTMDKTKNQSSVSLQDVYEGVRSPVYSGNAQLFAEALSQIKELHVASKEAMDEDPQIISFHPEPATDVSQKFMSEEWDEETRVNLDFLKPMLHSLLPQHELDSPLPWWEVDYAGCSREVDHWLENALPKSVVHALESILPPAWIDLIGSVPRGILSVILYLGKAMWRALMTGVRSLQLRSMARGVYSLWTN